MINNPRYTLNNYSKGTASKSASGASMSKYDVEVSARLKQLEKQSAVITLSVQLQEVLDKEAFGRYYQR